MASLSVVARLIEFRAVLDRIATSIGQSRFAQATISRLVPAYDSANRLLAKRRRLVACIVSIGLHCLLLLALLPHARSGLSGGGYGGTHLGEGEGVSLELMAYATVNRKAFETVEPETETQQDVMEADSLDDLQTDITGIVATEISSQLRLPRAVSFMSEPAQEKAASATDAAMGGEGEAGTSTGSVDDLWNAIAPCWRRLADDTTLPVNLTVSFAGNGMLAKAPVIDRQARNATDIQTLRSESLAITALNDCGMYQMAAGRENVAIHFPRP